jgi:predicted esterase
MKKRSLSLFVVLFISITALAQSYCIPGRFTKTDYFKDSSITFFNKVVYGSAIDWQGKPEELDMSVFMPQHNVDSLKKRPLLIFIHGGSFNGGSKTAFQNLARLLARQGFVTASINYRLGWIIDFGRTDTSFNEDYYRAIQDSKAAIRFLVHNAAEYGIDTSEIFLCGGSAGAMTILTDVFYTQATWDTYFPWLHKKLGATDNSTNTLTEHYSIKGLVSMWGQIRDTALITSKIAKRIPILLFHGSADPVVAYAKSDTLHYPKLLNPAYGSYLIAQRYKHLGACYELNTKINGGHGEDFSDSFLADKIGNFCASIFCGNCKSEEFSTTLNKK